MTKNLNRTATPWVIVMTHAPVYAALCPSYCPCCVCPELYVHMMQSRPLFTCMCIRRYNTYQAHYKVRV